MEREIIKLDAQQHKDLCLEDYLAIDEIEIPIEVVAEGYDGSGRHTESHHKVFKRLSDSKFFKVDYETSVKDSMGWDDCNYGPYDATEVFAEKVETIVYK